MFFAGLFIPILAGFGSNSGLLAAFVSQIVGKYPSRFLKHILSKHMVAMRWMLPVLFNQKFRKQQPITLISVQRSLTFLPFIVARFADSHELTEKDDWIFAFQLLDNFILTSCPITYSLFAPTPSTQYPFFNRAISTSCFATSRRRRSTSDSDLLR